MITEGSVWWIQCCVFRAKVVADDCLAKTIKLSAAGMDLEMRYKRVDRKALWDVLRIYGV